MCWVWLWFGYAYKHSFALRGHIIIQKTHFPLPNFPAKSSNRLFLINSCAYTLWGTERKIGLAVLQLPFQGNGPHLITLHINIFEFIHAELTRTQSSSSTGIQEMALGKVTIQQERKETTKRITDYSKSVMMNTCCGRGI